MLPRFLFSEGFMTQLIDVRSSGVAAAGDLAVKFEQQLPQEFLDDLKDRRNESDANPIRNMLHAARIPVAVVEQWMREGFNIYDKNVTGAQILARLSAQGLDAFILTKRSI